MKVILAEKPSVAKTIASFLGAKTRRDGYFEGNGYDSIVSYVLNYKENLIDVNSAIKKIHDNNKLSEYNFYRYGSLPILFITARNYRMPLPSSIIYKFL